MSQRGCLLSLTALFCAALDDLWTGSVLSSSTTHTECVFIACVPFSLKPRKGKEEIVIMNTHNKQKVPKSNFQSL